MRHFLRSFARTRIVAGGIILGALFISASLLYFQPDKASSASWWDEEYAFRQIISITNSGTEQTDFQVQVKVDTATLIAAGKMQSDCDDVRFAGQNGEQLSFFQATACDAAITRYWVKVNRIPTPSAVIYLYYGNKNVSSASNREATFDLSYFGTFSQQYSDGNIATNHGASSDHESNFYISNSTFVNHFNSSWVYQQQFAALDLYTGLCYDDKNARFYGIDWSNKQWSTFTTAFVETAPMDQALGDEPIDCATDSTYIYTNNRNGLIKRNKISDNSTNSINMDTLAGFDWGGQGMTYAYGYLFAGSTAAYGANGNRIYVIDISDWNNPRIVTYWDASGHTLTEVAGLTWKDKYIYQTDRSLDFANAWQGPVKTAATEPVVAAPASEERSPASIASWKFDEGALNTCSGGTNDACDGSGSNHDGAYQTGPTLIKEDQCISGKCLYFNGTNSDFVEVTDHVDFDLTQEGFTYTAWIKGTDFSKSYNMIMGHYLPYFNVRSTGVLHMSMTAAAAQRSVSGTTVLEVNKWYFVAASYDENGYLRVFLNGKEDGIAGPFLTPTNHAYNQYIGKWYNGDSYQFTGFIDEVKIYPYARTEDQIKSDYVSRGASKGSTVVLGSPDNSALNNGLVGYWKMDEASWNGTAGEVIDSSGVNNHGTRGGNATTTAAGKYGNGGTFDGSGDYVLVPATSSLDLQNLTIVSWNYATSYDQNMFMFEKTTNGSVNSQYSLFYDTGGASSRIYFRTVGLTPQDLSVTDNAVGPVVSKWNMIVGTYDASTGTKKVYINGDLVATQTGVTGTIATNPAGTSWIGTYGGGVGYPFNGKIDETRVYNRALSESEVQDLYQFSPGPVGYYTFDENSGLNAYDTSKNNYAGTLENTPSWTPGKIGSALDFNGTTNQVLVNTNYGIGTSNLTVSAWVNLPTSSEKGAFVKVGGAQVAGQDTNGTGYGIGVGGSLFENTGNDLLLLYEGVRWIDTNTTIGTGWHHVAMTVSDAGVPSAYIDGRLIGTYAGTGPIAPVGNSKIGGYVSTGATNRHFGGIVDDVRIYNYARTQDQIIQDMGASAVAGANSDPLPAPVVYFPLDEGYGTTTNNIGGGSSTLNGTLQNGPSWSSSGKVAKALSLDGTNDYLEVPNNTTLKYTGGDFTLSAWVNRNAAETNQGRIFSKPWNGSGQYNYVLLVNNDTTLIFSLLGATAWQTATTDTLPANAWTHLLVTVDGNTKAVKIYKNGALIKSDTHNITNWTPTIADANLPLAVGTLYPYGGAWGGVASHVFHGFIDEVKIYNATLTPEQALMNYNASAPEVMGSVSTASDGVTPDNSAGRAYCVPGDAGSCASPVVEFKLDENAGTTVYDTSGSGYSSTAFLGSPTWTSGKNSAALSFNGTTDGVSFSGPTTYATMTMTSWVYIDSASPTGDIVGYAHTNSNAYGFTFYIEGNTLRAKAETNADQYFYTNVTYDVTSLKNKWIHLGMSWQNLGTGTGGCDAEVKLYVNGALVDSATDNVTNTPYSCSVPYPYPFTMGATTANSLTRATKVKIDDIRVYNYVRTPAQIAWEYNKGGPVVHYKFDECEGTTIYNSAATGNDEPVGINGALSIGPTGTNSVVGTCTTSGAWADGVTGKEGASMDFDGTDDYVENTNSPDLSNRYSMSAWVFSTNFSANMYVTEIEYGAPLMYTGANRINATLRNNTNTAWNTYSSSVVLNNNAWNHILTAWDGNNVTIYHNGNLVGTGTHPGPIGGVTTAANLWVGGRSTVYFNGKIDDVRIYNYALTAAQVRDIHNNGAVSFK